MRKFIPSTLLAFFVFFGTFLYVGRWAGGETFLMALILGTLTFIITFMLSTGKITN